MTSLLVGLEGVAAQPCVGGMGEDGLHEEFQTTMSDLEHGPADG